jgi:hypothetical protein
MQLQLLWFAVGVGLFIIGEVMLLIGFQFEASAALNHRCNFWLSCMFLHQIWKPFKSGITSLFTSLLL